MKPKRFLLFIAAAALSALLLMGCTERVVGGPEDFQDLEPLEEATDSGRVAEVAAESLSLHISGTPETVEPKEFLFGDVDIADLDLVEGDTVKIVYYEESKELKEIEVLTRAEDGAETIVGLFIGQVDPHSIEVEIDETTKVLQLSDDVESKMSDIEENANVFLTYSENEQGEYVLIDIMVIEK